MAQTGQEALDAVDSFFETTWGAQATPASHPAAEDPAQHPGQPLPIMLPGAAPPAPPPQQHQHLARQSSHAEAHELAAHAAMGSYALAAVQQNGGNSGPPAHPHTARPAMPSRRSSFDGALHALIPGLSACIVWQRRDFLLKQEGSAVVCLQRALWISASSRMNERILQNLAPVCEERFQAFGRVLDVSQGSLSFSNMMKDRMHSRHKQIH